MLGSRQLYLSWHAAACKKDLENKRASQFVTHDGSKYIVCRIGNYVGSKISTILLNCTHEGHNMPYNLLKEYRQLVYQTGC
jgi:hypothetical protein